MSRIIDFPDGQSANTAPSILSGYEVVANQDITASGTITLGTFVFQVLKVTGTPGAVTASLIPFGTSPPNDGTIIKLEGQDNTNTVTITSNDNDNGVLLNGASVILKRFDIVELRYDDTEKRYIEQNRNF